MNTHLLSVVIPTYNRAALLREALNSIFEQGVRGVQVIVVDDGSTDDTRGVVSDYGNDATYVFQENRGTAAARNRGVSLARGEFISFLDSDDLWLPGKTATELSLFEKFPDAGAIISDSEYWTEDELTIPSRFAQRGVRFDDDAPRYFATEPPLWIDGSLFSTCCLTLRRNALERLGVFDTSFQSYEDWDFEIRMYHMLKVVLCPQVFAKVRRYDDGTRRDRPLPGRPPTPAQMLDRLRNQHRVLQKTLTLAALPAAVAERVRVKMVKLAEESARISEDVESLANLV
jgi:glycosyltransferase involved in cell wall biosynthesis